MTPGYLMAFVDVAIDLKAIDQSWIPGFGAVCVSELASVVEECRILIGEDLESLMVVVERLIEFITGILGSLSTEFRETVTWAVEEVMLRYYDFYSVFEAVIDYLLNLIDFEKDRCFSISKNVLNFIFSSNFSLNSSKCRDLIDALVRWVLKLKDVSMEVLGIYMVRSVTAAGGAEDLATSFVTDISLANTQTATFLSTVLLLNELVKMQV
jgi:hypothetical protein